jgi:cysteinyl-tRNA synthetase
MNPIHLTNTLTRSKELFTPIKAGHVSMYHCGPTVYGFIHIGNLRAFMLADTIRRLAEWNGYTVTQVMNITDIGHLVSDGDSGEDKMTKGLKREGMEVNLENMLALAEQYRLAFVDDIAALNIKMPHHLPKASDHIVEDIDIIKKLEDKGYTYQTSDGLYFDTAKMADYGKLGGLVKSSDSEARINENSEKRNSADFALWKLDSKHGWQSPWGQGFPGWHIECSGMSMKYLGETFDIHTGGHDLASVHHNNEIAQSECATGHTFVNYWLHNEFVNIGGEKMAKSGDNYITLRTVLEKDYDPLSYRMLLLQSHYRSQISFSWEALTAAQTALARLRAQISALPTGGTVIQKWVDDFTAAINDDLGTPKAIAIMNQMLASSDLPADVRATAEKFDEFLGLDITRAPRTETVVIPANVQELLDQRAEARAAKNWQLSDELRDTIAQHGFTVRDEPSGQIIE